MVRATRRLVQPHARAACRLVVNAHVAPFNNWYSPRAIARFNPRRGCGLQRSRPLVTGLPCFVSRNSYAGLGITSTQWLAMPPSVVLLSSSFVILTLRVIRRLTEPQEAGFRLPIAHDLQTKSIF
jgi:hypothetical protein